jgi:DNA-nicking Smr family endonuclease
MTKKNKITERELALFHQAVPGVKPITTTKILLNKHSTSTIRNPVKHKEPSFSLNDTGGLDTVVGDEFITYKQSGISHKNLNKLRKGHYQIEATLDLHGMTVDEAKIAVLAFLNESLNAEKRVVLIVHGKGRHSQAPILKNKLNQWLRSTDQILAFCSAAPIHGSRGAVYVLLKNIAR